MQIYEQIDIHDPHFGQRYNGNNGNLLKNKLIV